MIQRDYFMRMVEMLSTVLQKILFNIEKKQYEFAEDELETAAKTMVGLDLKLIKILSVEDILKLLKTSDIYAGRCLVSAELLKVYGDILGEKGKDKDSINIYIKSLWLYLETISTKELPEPGEYYPRINFLIKNLTSIGFPVELKLKIFEYYEISGQYSKAEDILFDIIDTDAEGVKEKAVNYYGRLRMKSEEELIKGNFSHEEIEESLEELNSRFQN